MARVYCLSKNRKKTMSPRASFYKKTPAAVLARREARTLMLEESFLFFVIF